MKIDSIGNEIALRRLLLGEEELFVRIGCPTKHELDGDYFCPYSIEQPGKKRIGYAMGIDSVQSLQLALRKIAAELDALSARSGRSVEWLSDASQGHGF